MANNKHKILIVEDDAAICMTLKTLLEANDYHVLTAKTCGMGISMFLSHMPDAVLLDLGLPDRDGEEFIKKAREASLSPIIVLSAREGENDKISALDLGANDYITKPFISGELLARIRVALRSGQKSVGEQSFLSHGLLIDYEKRMVSVNGCEIKLTRNEYNIVKLLSQNSGKVMTYAAIVRTVWGGTDYDSTKKLQVNMANIRKKLGIGIGNNPYIINELGVGYRMIEADSKK